MSENRQSRSRGRRSGRGRTRNRGRGRSSAPASSPAKKKNPITALLSRLFGGGETDRKKSGRGARNGKPAERRARPAASAPEDEPMPEVNSNRLYIGNLPYESTESELFDHFAPVGQVKNVEIVRDGNNRSKGFAFVEMNSVETAKTVSEKFHRTEFQGRQIIVAGAKN